MGEQGVHGVSNGGSEELWWAAQGVSNSGHGERCWLRSWAPAWVCALSGPNLKSTPQLRHTLQVALWRGRAFARP